MLGARGGHTFAVSDALKVASERKCKRGEREGHPTCVGVLPWLAPIYQPLAPASVFIVNWLSREQSSSGSDDTDKLRRLRGLEWQENHKLQAWLS